MPLHVLSTIVLIIRRSKLYYTASGIITLCRWPSCAQVERRLNVCPFHPDCPRWYLMQRVPVIVCLSAGTYSPHVC